MLLGQRIRELRKRKGDTLKETSKDTELSVSYLILAHFLLTA